MKNSLLKNIKMIVLIKAGEESEVLWKSWVEISMVYHDYNDYC